MKIVERKLDCVLLAGKKIADTRGWFYIPVNTQSLHELGIAFREVYQLNHSYTKEKGIVRGLNYQEKPFNQAKLVRCIKGDLWSVAVNIDRSSPLYGKWCGFRLSAENQYLMYVPNNYAHGFVSLQEHTELEYLTDNAYCFERAKSVAWNDPDICIDWTCDGLIEVNSEIMSEKNKNASLLNDIVF